MSEQYGLRKNITISGVLIILFSLATIMISGCNTLSADENTPAATQPDVTTTETQAPVETTAEPTPEPTPDPASIEPSADAPVIALTFDDGPSLYDTGPLLDLLAAEDVSATFFVLGGQIETGREDLVKRAYDEGHEIGNHTYSHQILTDIDPTEVKNELTSTNTLIENITGSAPTIMRPPTGAWSDEVAGISAELNLAVINWDWQSCPEDWNHHDDPQHIADHVIETAENGHIVLLHDTNKATVTAMPDMIAGLKERGFRFMTVSQMLSFLGEDHPQAGRVYHTYANPE